MIDEDLLLNLKIYNKNRKISNNLFFKKNQKYENILTARYHKVSRIKQDLVYLICRHSFIWFCTFTYDNYYINCCERTKKDLIKKVLNHEDFKYLMNKDYGSKTEREHYHVILATNYNVDIHLFLKEHYPCFSSAQRVNTTLNDVKRLSKYINKLTNHCIKDSTCNSRLYKNFKSYPFCKTKDDLFIQYTLERSALLDKADIIGKISLLS